MVHGLMSKKTRAAAFGAFVGVFLAAYSIGGLYKMSEEDANNFVNEFHGAVQEIDAIGIFSHNISVALPMFIPAFGLAWGSYTAWSTGAAFAALTANNPILANLPPVSIFLFSPFGPLELGAYSLAMSRSFLVLFRIIRRNPIRKEALPTAIEVGIVFALLLIAGFIEYDMISHAETHVSLSKP